MLLAYVFISPVSYEYELFQGRKRVLFISVFLVDIGVVNEWMNEPPS